MGKFDWTGQKQSRITELMVILLDVDGVLVTGPAQGGHWSDRIEADLGLSAEALRQAFFAPHWAGIVTGQSDMMPKLSDALAQIAAPVSAQDLRDYWFAQDATLDQSVLKDIGTLRSLGWQVWLATNQEHQRAQYLMQQMGLAEQVDGIIYSAAVGAKKPDLAFYRAAFAVTGQAPDQHLMIDDTSANIDAIRRLGGRGIVWRQGMSLQEIAMSEKKVPGTRPGVVQQGG